MRLILLSVVILYLTIDTRCGVVVNMFEKMKNTTNDIKHDIKGWISTGKDFVFGDHNHEGAKETENAPDCNNHKENHEGIIKGLIRKVHDKVDHVKENIHNLFTGNAENHNTVESTTKVTKEVGASDKVDFQNNKNDENSLSSNTNGVKPTNPIQNPLKDTLVDSDDNFNIDIRGTFTKGNETVQNVKTNVEETANNVKNTVNNTEEIVVQNVKDFQDNEEFIAKVPSNIKSKIDKQGNSFMEDLKKQM